MDRRRAVCRRTSDRQVSLAMTAMEFTSTRDSAHTAGFGAALLQGLAPDGGLYVPRAGPMVRAASFAGQSALPDVAARLLAPFAEGDPLAAFVPAITSDA